MSDLETSHEKVVKDLCRDITTLGTHLNSALNENEKLKQRVEKLEQEVKSGIFEAACFDLDVITCLTKIAYEHNADDIPRYREKAKRCAERISKRTSDLNKFALEKQASEFERYASMCEAFCTTPSVETLREHAKQLRKEQEND